MPDKFDLVQLHAEQGTYSTEVLEVGYIGKKQSRCAKTGPERVTMGYVEANAKFITPTSGRSRILIKLFERLDVEAPITPGKIVVVMYRAGDAI